MHVCVAYAHHLFLLVVTCLEKVAMKCVLGMDWTALVCPNQYKKTLLQHES